MTPVIFKEIDDYVKCCIEAKGVVWRALMAPNSSGCDHGFKLQAANHPVALFLHSIYDESSIGLGMKNVKNAYNKVPEALDVAVNRKMILDALVSLGTNALLDESNGSLQRERYIARSILTIEQYDQEV